MKHHLAPLILLMALSFLVWQSASQNSEPTITVSAYPQIQDFGGYVNSTAIASNATEAYVTILKPDNNLLGNFSMIKAAPDRYFYNRTYNLVGEYRYWVWANFSGNWSSSHTDTFKIVDRQPPSAPLNLNITTPVWDNKPAFVWDHAIDNETGIHGYAYSLDKFPENRTDRNFTTSLYIKLGTTSDGEHIFYVKAMDKSGNWGPVISMDFLIDTPPHVIIKDPEANQVIDMTGYDEYNYTIVTEVYDALGIERVEFYADNELIGTESGAPFPGSVEYKMVWNIKEALNPTVKVMAYDKSGNIDSESITVKIVKITASDYERILQMILGSIGEVENLKVISFAAVEGKKEYNVNISGIPPIKNISFMLNETRTAVSLGIATFRDRPSLVPVGVSGNVYKYFAIIITDPKLQSIPVLSMNVTFSVEKQWILSYHIDKNTIGLSNLPSLTDLEWNTLGTKIIQEDNNTVDYRSHSEETWMFAISGKEYGIASLFLVWLGAIPAGYLLGGLIAIISVAGIVGIYRVVEAFLAKRRKDLVLRKKAMLAPIIKRETPTGEFYAENVTVIKGNRSIVERISFSFSSGKIIAVLGPSGSGKSTILKAIIGENDYIGSISVFGLDVKKDMSEIKRLIGYVPQDLQLYRNMTVRENIRYFGNQYGIKKREADARGLRICRVLNIDNRMNTKVEVLSGGEQRRASIATALVHNPQLLILDEPTSGLDPITRRTLWRFLKKLNMELGISIITTTHFVDEGEYADIVLIVNRGRVVAYDSPANLKQSIPGKGKAVEVELFRISDPIMRRIKKLEKELRIKDLIEKADYTGYHAKFYTGNPHLSAGQILESFNKADIGFRTINVVDVSLEDVFIYYTGERFKGGEA